MRLAYLVNLYPSPASHYARGEIAELRRQGVEVSLISLRRFDGYLPNVVHRSHAAETTYVREQGALRLVATTLATLARQPIRFCRAARMAWSMARRARKSPLHPFAYLVQSCSLLMIVRRIEADYLHVQMASNAGAVARLTRCLGGPDYAMMVHGPEEFEDLHLYAIADKIADSSFTMAVSEARTQQLRAYVAGTDRCKVHTIRCGLATERQHPTEVPDVHQFACVARLVERKGHRLLIEAASRLVHDYPDLRIVCVGDGEQRSVLESIALDAGVEEHVVFVGTLDPASVIEQIKASRAFILASHDETLPLAIVEAFACHRPAICTNVGSVGEVVSDGDNGWLVPPDVDALANAMREALAAPVARLAAMGHDGARVVAERHSIKAEVGKIVALYEGRSATMHRRTR